MKRKKIPFKRLYTKLYSELPEETKQYFKLRISFEELNGYYGDRITLELVPKQEMYSVVLIMGEKMIADIFEDVLKSELNARVLFSEARLYKDGDKLSPYLANIIDNPNWGFQLYYACSGQVAPMKTLRIFLDFYIQF